MDDAQGEVDGRYATDAGSPRPSAQTMTGFEERLLDYAAAARYRRRASSLALFAISNGETDYALDRHPQGYALAKKDRGAGRYELISSRELDVVQRYLVMQVAADVRAHARLSRIALEGVDAALPAGFELDSSGGSVTLTWQAEGNTHQATFPPAGRSSAVRFAYYADRSLDDLERSVADPAGRPLFAS